MRICLLLGLLLGLIAGVAGHFLLPLGVLILVLALFVLGVECLELVVVEVLAADSFADSEVLLVEGVVELALV